MIFFDANNPINWREIPFEQLVTLVKPRLEFHAYKHKDKIPGFDKDDIYQELCFILWKKLDKIPAEIEVFDYRLMRYIDTIFFREVTNIWRKHTVGEGESRVFRDELNRSLPMIDNFDEIHEH